MDFDEEDDIELDAQRDCYHSLGFVDEYQWRMYDYGLKESDFG